MARTVHKICGYLATMLIASFFLSTIAVEVFGTHHAIAMVKSLIVIPGLLMLIPVLIVTGGSGVYLAKFRSGRIIAAKKRRTPIVAFNGVFILVPCAIFLDRMAASGTFDTMFTCVQAVELLAGATNLLLMGMNIRDGRRMSGQRISG